MKELIAKASPKLPKHDVEEIGDRVWLRLNAEMEQRKDELALRSLYGDGWNNAPALEEGDFQILSAVHLLAGKGTALDILDMVERCTGQTLLVAPRVERLEKEGLLAASRTGDRRYEVTERGQHALGRAKLEGKQFARVVEAPAREERVKEALPEKAD